VRTPVPAFLDTSSTSLRAGSNAAEGSYIDGLLDEVKLFDRALTEQEVQDIYRAGSQGECR